MVSKSVKERKTFNTVIEVDKLTDEIESFDTSENIIEDSFKELLNEINYSEYDADNAIITDYTKNFGSEYGANSQNSSDSEIPSGTLNTAEKYTSKDEKKCSAANEKCLDTEIKSSCNETEDEEIPPITIRNINKPANSEFSKHQTVSAQKVLPLQILDIHLSEIVTKKPYLYSFMDTEYKYTKILGTVIGINVKSNRVTLGVEDGTAFIYCIMDSDESLTDDKKEDLDEFHEFDSPDSEDTTCDDSIFNAITNTIVQKTEKHLKQYPSPSDFQLGDNVTVVGKVVDLHERLIFAWFIRRDSSVETYLKHMRESVEKKKNYYTRKRTSDL